MANDFSKDVTCKALWRFEPGALAVDSIGSNTLTPVNTPTSGADYQEGAGSINFVTGSNQYAYINDASLVAGFPLKNGDSLKQATFLIRVYPATSGNARQLISKIASGNLSFWTAIHLSQLIIYWAYNATQFYTYNTGVIIPVGGYTHLAIRLDGVNEILNVRAYRYSNSTIYTYGVTPGAALNVSNGPFSIAATSAADAGYMLDGEVDELVVFNRLLTDAQIDKVRSQTYGPIDFTTSMAAVSTAAAPQLKVTRELQQNMAMQSAVSSPLLAVLRKLVTSEAVLSATGAPSLLVKRDLVTALAPLSATTTPNLLVQRSLAVMAAILSETSDINVLTAAVRNLITAMAAQSQTSAPVLKVLRDLSSTMSGDTQTSTVTLTRLMRLVSTLSAETETSNPNLIVLRTLATAIAAQTQTWIPLTYGSGHTYGDGSTYGELLEASLLVKRDLTATLAMASETSNPLLAVLRLLTASLPIESHTPDIGMGTGATWDLVSTMAIQSQTPEVSLKVLRDLVSSMAGESATSEITMQFLRRLTTAMAAVTATSNPLLAVPRDLITAIAIESQTSEIGFMFTGYVPEHLRVRALVSQLQAELSAPELRAELALRQLKGE